jgi:5-methylcytosine-specific restriction endonuclease McrA
LTIFVFSLCVFWLSAASQSAAFTHEIHTKQGNMKFRTRNKKTIAYVNALHNDPEWQTATMLIRTRDGYKCKICGSNHELQVHHITYRDFFGNSIRGKETQFLQCLVLVCGDCHEKIHKNVKHMYNPNNSNKSFIIS